MATATNELKINNLSVSQAPHLAMAIQVHNERVQAGKVEGTLIDELPDTGTKRSQVYQGRMYKEDVESLIQYLSIDLREEVKAKGKKQLPTAADHLLKKLKEANLKKLPKEAKAPKAQLKPQEPEAASEAAQPKSRSATLREAAERKGYKVVDLPKAPDLKPEDIEGTPTSETEEETAEPAQAAEPEYETEVIGDVDMGLDALMAALADEEDEVPVPEPAKSVSVKFEEPKPELKAVPKEEPKATSEKAPVKPQEPPKPEPKAQPQVDPESPEGIALAQMELGKNPIADAPGGILDLSHKRSPWKVAIDCVNYPVLLRELFFYDLHGELAAAEAETNTGRPSKLYGVAVDRDRTGHLSTISSVTGTYGTIPPHEVYADLMKELRSPDNDYKARPTRIYVSPDGGRQVLHIEFDGILDTKTAQDEMKMSMHLVTSVDGSTRHHVRLIAHNVASDCEVMGIVKDQNFSLATRHTRTLKDRHVAFRDTLATMVKEWNNDIAPMMALFNGVGFDREYALSLIESIMLKAKIPQQHIDNAKTFYKKDQVTTNVERDTPFRVLTGVSQYLTKSLEDRPERLDRFRDALNRNSQAVIYKALEKLRKQ